MQVDAGASNNIGFLGTFSFEWSKAARSLKISKKGRRQLHQDAVRNDASGVGCGRKINWSQMAPVEVPAEFNTGGPPVTVDDIKLVHPRSTYQVIVESLDYLMSTFRNSFQASARRS